jgi:hypothetical protein
MLQIGRPGRALALTAIFAVVASAGSLHAQSSALQVGARVAPQCLITVDDQSDDRSPAVTVSCGASTLRALRVTTTRGEEIVPVQAANLRQLKAGGDFVFVVAQPVAAVASLGSVLPASARRPGSVTVTLDF